MCDSMVINVIFEAVAMSELCRMNCYHCGDPCDNEQIEHNEKFFCCNGCKTVFEILHENGMDKFYTISETAPGVKRRSSAETVYFDFLDLEEYQKKYILFQDDNLSKVQFYLPQIHCNSCIWLLENINKLNPEIMNSEVNFSTKTIHITVKKGYDLKKLAFFLDSLGYPPEFTSQNKKKIKQNKTLVYKIGVAGFCFGNIMLFSFPEYLGLSEDAADFRKLFLYLSFFLTLPALFYSGFDYLKYAYYGLKNKVFNMELPIAIGLIALFLRSSYELIDFNSQAYFDSLSGLIFFLLIGKWYQDKTFSNLRFNTDKRSYFPMAVQVVNQGSIEIYKTEDLKVGLELLIRNYELIPTDATLLDGDVQIDYSFVTGESEPVTVRAGQIVYAGGRLLGEPAKMMVAKNVNDGYLTGLWNAKSRGDKDFENQLTKISNNISRYFTIFLIILSALTALYWYFSNAELLWRSVVSVLIVACPCALALSIPFTYGNALTAFGQRGLFFRKSEVIDQITQVTDIVFDKTGTLTTGQEAVITSNVVFTTQEKEDIVGGCSNSIHPLSQAICGFLDKYKASDIRDFSELEGQGLSFNTLSDSYQIGSAELVGTAQPNYADITSYIFVKKNGVVLGYFQVKHAFRKNLESLIDNLSKKYKVHLLSGDNDRSADFIKEHIGISSLHFNQTPDQKREFVERLQTEGKKVLMLGDGINDGKALEESYFGVAVVNSSQGFKPSCDAILEGDSLTHLEEFLKFATYCKRVVVTSFIISFLYNVIGLTIAVQGIFAPVVAALLMPISSVSVVLFATTAIHIYNKKMGKRLK